MLELTLCFLPEFFFVLLLLYFFINFLYLSYSLTLVQRVLPKVEFRLELNFFRILLFLFLFCLIYYNYMMPVCVWYLMDFSYQSDYFTIFFSSTVLVVYAFLILILILSKKDLYYYFEYFFIFIFIGFFSLFLFKIYDFLYMYVLIECISISLYILASSNISSIKISEAGLKYFILGSISSLFLLYGMFEVYYFFGTLNFFKIRFLIFLSNISLLNYDLYNSLFFGILLLLIAFFFKIGAAPFHVWVVDVYSGVSWFTFFILSVVSKLIFLIFFLKVVIYFFSFFELYLSGIYLFVGFFSIIVGTYGAFLVKNFRALLAYGSIVHVGFILLSFISLNYYSIFAYVVYVYIYVFLMLSFSAVIIYIIVDLNDFVTIFQFKFIRGSSLILSFLIFSLLISMGGLPPFIGFFAKMFILFSLNVNNLNFFYLIILVLFFNIFNLYIYLRFSIYLFFGGDNYMLLRMTDGFTYFIISLLIVNIFGFFFLDFFNKYLYSCYLLSIVCYI